jgi:hypothetical protein
MSGQDELTGRTGDTRARIAEDMDTEVADALSVAVITRWIVDMLILGSANDTPIIGLPRWKESILIPYIMHRSPVGRLLDRRSTSS